MSNFSLVIAEKPSVGAALAKVIGANRRHDGYMEGNGYLVSWCFGHLAELARADAYDEHYAKWRYDDLPIVPQNWEFTLGKDKSGQFELLRDLMNRNDVTEVINACDAGREGELIFRTVYYLAGCTKTMKRLWISSMEEDAIRAGFNDLKPGSMYDGLYQSALCRSKADWLVGINATRLFSILYHRKLNVGRVISPTLSLIVQRECEIDSFKPEPYYTVHLDCVGFEAVSGKIPGKSEAETIRKTCENQSVTVKSVERREKSEKAPLPFDLTTLQRTANKTLGYTAQQTLDYLQSLYEKKLCTYPRTDSRYLTTDMAAAIPSLVWISADICNRVNIMSLCFLFIERSEFMPTKLQYYSYLAERTAEQLTDRVENWTSFLTTSARLYKYPYHEQLMIYAQRPDATACAEYDVWNNRMGRYVRRGSIGIALLDTTSDTPRLRYVFDVSDTGTRARSRDLNLWTMQPEHESPVADMLMRNYDVSDAPLEQMFLQTARYLAEEYWDNHHGNILDIVDNSFLEEYDDYTIETQFLNAATVSTLYSLLSRCGRNPEEYLDDEDFRSIFDFNTPYTIAALGIAVSEISEQILRDIELTIKTYERTHEYEERETVYRVVCLVLL